MKDLTPGSNSTASVSPAYNSQPLSKQQRAVSLEKIIEEEPIGEESNQAFEDQLVTKEEVPLKNLLGELEDILGPFNDKNITLNPKQ